MKGKIVWLILFVAFLLRFISVKDFPAGFNADEASLGYDAYSILHTGRDQWGNYLPLVLKSFGDYKPPLYTYLSIPSIAIFGLNVFATRLPNVIIGTLAVFAVYLLMKEITDRKSLAIIAGFLLAFNPWSIMMSRGAFEANLITFFLPMGVYFFLKGIKNSKFFLWSAVFLGLNLFTYHSAKLITPLVLMGLIFIFKKHLMRVGFKKLAIPVIIIAIFFGTLLVTFRIGGGSRITERSIFQGALIEGFDKRMAAISKGQDPKLAKILHNKYTISLSRFKNNYIQYFSPKFLIKNGAGEGSYGMIPGIGAIYFLEYLMLFGVIPLVLIEKKFRKVVYAILIWLAITPLTGALASGVGYSGNRAEGMLPVLQIVETFGFLGWTLLLKRINRFLPKIAIGLFTALLIFEFFGFTKAYFKMPETSVLKQMLYGNLEVASWLMQNGIDRKALISRSISEPQIFLAFVSKWDPTDYQKYTKSWNLDESNVTWVDQLPAYSLGNYTIKSIDWKTDTNNNALIVARADELIGTQIPIKSFNYPDGMPNIYIIDTDQKLYAKTN